MVIENSFNLSEYRVDLPEYSKLMKPSGCSVDECSSISIQLTSVSVTYSTYKSKNITSPQTADTDILITSRNGDRKIMKSIRIMSEPSIRIRK